jgi:hypothetical protein
MASKSQNSISPKGMLHRGTCTRSMLLLFCHCSLGFFRAILGRSFKNGWVVLCQIWIFAKWFRHAPNCIHLSGFHTQVPNYLFILKFKIFHVSF